MPRHPRSLKILNWNASSVISKKAEFQHLLHRLSIDIACVSETFLKPHISFNIPHYSIYRTDRVTHGGGTAILIKSTIPHAHTPLTNLTNIETTTIALYLGKDKILLSACYKPPNKILFPSDLDAILPRATTAVAIGDFNAKNTVYHCNSTNSAGVTLLNYANLKPDIQLHIPSEPTRSPLTYQNPDILDIAISINWKYPTTSTVLNELSSDHLPVVITVDSLPQFLCPFPNKPNYDWTIYRDKLTILTTTPTLASPNDVDNATLTLQNNIMTALKASEKKKSYVPQYYRLPPEITELMTRRNKIRRDYQTYRLPHIKTEYKDSIRGYKNLFWLTDPNPGTT